MAVKRVPPASGYSGTRLIDKLGIKPQTRVQFVSEPPNFTALLGKLPTGCQVAPRGELDFAILFVTTRADLEKRFDRLRDRLKSNGMLWISWPKKTSGVPSDLTENTVREIGLANGLVDVKVCAIDET